MATDSFHAFGDFFCSKKILITGHTGFKGGWLSFWLKELGANVVGYSLEPPTPINFFSQVGLANLVESIHGDVRDLDHLTQVVRDTKPEIVFHLAAQPLVQDSYRKPAETFSTNVMGTVNLLEAIRNAGHTVRVCQIITSDKCYQNLETGTAHSEDDPLGGLDPYSASKAGAELVVNAYRNSYFSPEKITEHSLSLSSVRAGNVLGGGDWGANRIGPDCIRALIKGEPVLIRNPKATRPWQYILDVLSGYLFLASQQATLAPTYASAWNFGPDTNQDLSVLGLATKVIRCWGSGSYTLQNPLHDRLPTQDFREMATLRLDCAKARNLLNWQPVLDIEEGIVETVLWYRETQGAKTREAHSVTRRLLQNYLQKAKERSRSWALPHPALR